MRFVDANVFIYQFIQSPKDDFEISGKILDRIEGGEPAVTSVIPMLLNGSTQARKIGAKASLPFALTPRIAPVPPSCW